MSEEAANSPATEKKREKLELARLEGSGVSRNRITEIRSDKGIRRVALRK